MGKRKGQEIEPMRSCHGLARVTMADHLMIAGCSVPIAAPDDHLREYQEGTLYVNREGALAFRPDDNPNAAYILSPAGGTSFTYVDERTGNRITVEPFGLSLYDAIVDEQNLDAQRVASWFNQR